MNANLRTYLAAAIALPLTACAHAAMMGGMGLGIGMMGHSGGGSGCARETKTMEAHLPLLDTIPAEELVATIPSHVRRLEALLDSCAPRASDASPAADTVRLMVDQLRDDLSRLPQVTPGELAQFMPQHTARLRAFLFRRQGGMHGHDTH